MQKLTQIGLHPIIYAPAATALGVTTLVAMFLWWSGAPAAATWILLPCVAGSMILAITAWWRSFTTRFEIEGRDSTLTTGFISRQVQTLTKHDVAGVSIDQGFWARIFGYADVTLKDSGGRKLTISTLRVPDPFALKSALTQ